MKIIYVGKNNDMERRALAQDGDVLILSYDRWDDFGYKTRFPTTCRIDGENIELGAVRILFEGKSSSHPFLTKLRHNGWDREFPVPEVNYISVPEEVTFYEQLMDLLPETTAMHVAIALRDASYLAHIARDPDALSLIDTNGFGNSLLRERAAQRAFAEGYKILGGEALEVADLSFDFRDVNEELSTLKLNFSPRSLLPHDINVIIGPNGVGKSSLVRQMIRAWIQPERGHHALKGAKFHRRPNLSQMVAVSYSPFERFPVDTDNEPSLSKPLKDKDIYRFFGFRGRLPSQKTGRPSRIRNSLAVPRSNACRSLIQCLVDDRRFGKIKAWANKLTTLQRVLGSGIEFDVAAVKLQPDTNIDEVVSGDPFGEFEAIQWADEDDDNPDIFVPIAPGDTTIDTDALLRLVDLEEGVTFFKDDEPLRLSSGQRLFFYIVVNVLGVIRRNSVVIVDEPELFLHPTLEIQFITMLKDILRTYDSKALIATHSVLTVREVPSRCVHVLEQTDDGLKISAPPFETFGGDVQRISSYVFGDRSISKPHDSWLEMLLDKFGTAEAVLEALGGDLNEEMIIQLNAMERGQW